MPVDNEVAGWVVLIVDDEPDNLGVARKILSFYGAEVHLAEDGQNGLEVLSQIEPSFILLDLSMPTMDGWEMLKRVRTQPETADLPVIALTAHAMPGDEDRALEAGFDGYITKPFRLSSLLDDIKQCLPARE
jgi:two-component system, cell cycle response regulator DivK